MLNHSFLGKQGFVPFFSVKTIPSVGFRIFRDLQYCPGQIFWIARFNIQAGIAVLIDP